MYSISAVISHLFKNATIRSIVCTVWYQLIVCKKMPLSIDKQINYLNFYRLGAFIADDTEKYNFN